MLKKFRVNENVLDCTLRYFSREKKLVGKVLAFDEKYIRNGCYVIGTKYNPYFFVFQKYWLDSVPDDTPADDVYPVVNEIDDLK